MLKENQSEFDKTNINYWRSKGYTGKATIVVLDDYGKPRDKDNIETPFNDSGEVSKHKTQVCGVIREVAPNARIIAFNWFGGDKNKIVNWIIQHKDEIDIVNCSFVSGLSTTENHIKQIYDIGITIMCGSGNGENTNRISKPAKFSTTIAIGAFEESRDKVAYYSNGGEELDALAFTDIWIPTYNTYTKVKFDGTSCACPVTSGMFAYYVEWRNNNKLPKIHPDESKKFIQRNTRDLYDVGFDMISGYGLFKLPSEIPIVESKIDIIREEEDMSFKDTSGHWAEQYIDYVVAKGYMNGKSADVFEPNSPITRAEFAVVMARKDGFVPVKK